MTELLIHYKKQGALADIQLNRPEALNALSLEMIRTLKRYLQDAFTDNSIKSIWLTANSERAFCAGGDVKALVQELKTKNSDDERYQTGLTYFSEEYELDLMINASVKPIVAFGQGLIFGGGWGLFAGANLRLVAENAELCMPENQIGFFPDVGAAYFLQKPNWVVGTFLGISGLRLSAKEALALDYVDDVISENYAKTLKQQLVQGIDVTELAIDTNISIQQTVSEWNDIKAQLVEDASLSDWVSIIQQSSNPIFSRADALISSGSSWSIALTWHYFRKARTSSLAQVLKEEAKVSAFLCSEPDFLNGVCSKLIQKEQPVNWRYSQIESVPISEIEQVLFQ